MTKLTLQDVRFIRHWRKKGYTLAAIAKVFNISDRHVSAIARNKTWVDASYDPTAPPQENPMPKQLRTALQRELRVCREYMNDAAAKLDYDTADYWLRRVTNCEVALNLSVPKAKE